MTSPAYQVGEKLVTGQLLRYVPNWYTHWDESAHRPRARAFRRRKAEKSVSMFLEGTRPEELWRCVTSIERLRRAYPDFAIARVSVERLIKDTGAWVEYQPAADIQEGHAHFEVMNLPKSRSANLADFLAEIVAPPGPIRPVDNPRTEVIDE